MDRLLTARMIARRALKLLTGILILSGLSAAYCLFLWGFTPGSLADGMIGGDGLYAWTAARYRAAGTADRLEVIGLTGGDSFEQGQVVCRATLEGNDLVEIASLWKSLDFDIKHDGMCHFPVYRLKFYSGLRKKLDATACWKCGNLNPASIFPPVPKMGFDSGSPDARRLYKALQARCPGTPALEEKQVPSSKP